MNYLIVGLGSVGTILAYSLKLEKDDKIFALRSKKSPEKSIKTEIDVIDYLKDKIKLKNQRDENQINILQYEDEPIDIVFITTKANHLIGMNKTLEKIKLKNPKLICLMNGMGWESYFDDFDRYYGIIMYNAFKNNGKVLLGSKGGLILDKNLENILKNKFDIIPVSFTQNIEDYRYRKLWLNTINGFLSLFGFSLNQFFEESKKLDNRPLAIFKRFLEETKEIYERLKINPVPLPSLDPQTLIDLIHKLLNFQKFDEKEEKLYNNLPKGKNSTLQSIEKREETEYRFLGGYLVKLADKLKSPYKLNRFVNEKIEKYDLTGEFEFLSLNDFLLIYEKYIC